MPHSFGRDAKQIRVQVGKSFVLALPARATAGYIWRVVQTPAVLALVREEISSDPARPGARATQELEFRSVKPGSGTLVLEYKRPWEATAAERMELGVVVESSSQHPPPNRA